MKNKFFARIIITTLLVTFLTLNVGRVTRVSAVASTTAIAGAAFIATGLVYMSYLALTGAQVSVPIASDLHDWLGDVGRKVAQFPSGSHTYEEMYKYYAVQRDPLAVTIDGVWTWTEEKLKSFINDFSDTRIIQEIVSYETELSFLPPALPYDYRTEVHALPSYAQYYSTTYPFSYFVNQGYVFNYGTGPRVVLDYNASGCVAVNSWLQGTYRNAYDRYGYFAEKLVNGHWEMQLVNALELNIVLVGNDIRYLIPNPSSNDWFMSDYNSTTNVSSGYLSYPVFCDLPLYNYITGETTEVIPQESTEVVNTPQWLTDPDNDNRPIVPWVPIPQLPNGVTPPSGYNNIDQWGFNLEDLLDDLADLGEAIFDLSVLKELINAFAGQHGDQYYLYYDDGDDNYYYYYQPTNYNGDYVTYNIDISEQEDIIPVDLNTIQLYTDNTYIDTVKFHAKSFGQMLGEYIVFWHNSDPETLYTLLGSFVIILIGAFIGKWGHS